MSHHAVCSKCWKTLRRGIAIPQVFDQLSFGSILQQKEDSDESVFAKAESSSPNTPPAQACTPASCQRLGFERPVEPVPLVEVNLCKIKLKLPLKKFLKILSKLYLHLPLNVFLNVKSSALNVFIKVSFKSKCI